MQTRWLLNRRAILYIYSFINLNVKNKQGNECWKFEFFCAVSVHYRNNALYFSLKCTVEINF